MYFLLNCRAEGGDMTFWQWANRKSESAIELVLKLILAIVILIGFGYTLNWVLNRVDQHRLGQPRLTAEICASPAVLQVVQGNFVNAYNEQAWFGHLLPQDVSLTRASATDVLVDIQRVRCVGWVMVGAGRPEQDRVGIQVQYSAYRESGSPQLLVQTSFRGADFMGRGLDELDRDGRVRHRPQSKG